MNHYLKAIIFISSVFISLLIHPNSFVELNTHQITLRKTNLSFNPDNPDLGKDDYLTKSISGKKDTTYKSSLIELLKLKTYSPDVGSLTNKSITKAFKVKGVHVTSWVAGSERQFKKIINLIRETELNTVVIDLKEVDGIIGYNVNVKLAKEINAIQPRIKDIDEIISLCDKYGIYKIARITVFKDNCLATHKPYLAIGW